MRVFLDWIINLLVMFGGFIFPFIAGLRGGDLVISAFIYYFILIVWILCLSRDG